MSTWAHTRLFVGSCFNEYLGSHPVICGFMFQWVIGITPGYLWVHVSMSTWAHTRLFVGSCFNEYLGSHPVMCGFMFQWVLVLTPGYLWVHVSMSIWAHTRLFVGSCCSSFFFVVQCILFCLSLSCVLCTQCCQLFYGPFSLMFIFV